MNRTTAWKAAPLVMAMLLIAAVASAAPQEPSATDVTAKFTGLTIDGFRAVEVGGIVVLRGRTFDRAQAEQAAIMATTLGYTRVANLVQVSDPIDDAAIERMAERRIGLNRSLDGCSIHIDSDQGAVRLAGTVKNELQKDVAVQTLRSIDGVKSVTSDLKKF